MQSEFKWYPLFFKVVKHSNSSPRSEEFYMNMYVESFFIKEYPLLFESVHNIWLSSMFNVIMGAAFVVECFLVQIAWYIVFQKVENKMVLKTTSLYGFVTIFNLPN